MSYSRDNVHNEETNCCACPMPGNLEFRRHMDRSFLCSMNLGEKYRFFLLILVVFFYHHCLNFLFIVNLKNKSNRRCDEHELIKEYLKLFNRLYDINWFGALYAYITCSKISNIPYNLFFTTKFNDSSILITIISCDYLNLSLANEYVGDITIPTQVIKYNQHFLQADQQIRLHYSHQIKLLTSKMYWSLTVSDPQTPDLCVSRT